MAKSVHEATVEVDYAVYEYEDYFGEGRHAYDVLCGAFESDYLFESLDEAIGEVHRRLRG